MKFTISQENLVNALQTVIGVVPSKTTFPILSNILLEAKSNKELFLTTTDLDVAITSKTKAEVSVTGSITVPAKQFFGIVRELPDVPVEVAVEEQKVTLRYEKGEFKIVGIAKEEFPELPKVEKGLKIKVSSPLIQSAIRRTIFAVSTDTSRPALCGSFWRLITCPGGKGEEMEIVTTDGHRLGRVKIHFMVSKAEPLPKTEQKGQLIISAKGLNQLIRVISETVEEMEINFDERFVLFNLGETQIYSRLVEGPYPSYEEAIPKESSKRLLVNREALISAVRRVSVLSETFSHQIRLDLSSNLVQLSSSTPDVGEAKEVLSCDYAGDEMAVGYNATYLLDILRNIESDEVLFSLNTSLSAGIITPSVQKEGEELLYLLMPIRLPEET
ncbi:MAG: DNA polymerase III subunit beta [Candidatus Edwardsbacteria bacterium]